MSQKSTLTNTSTRTLITLIHANQPSSHLEEHSDDGHHCQPAVRQLGRQLFGFLRGVAGGQDLEAKVACCGRRASGLVLGNLAEGHVGKDLSPARGGHFGDRSQAVWHVGKLKAGRW